MVLADLLDGGDRVLRRRLHAGDLRADLVGRLGGLRGERLTSWATTAKPLPASPARAASMVALSASRLVCSAIAVMSLTTSPMRPAACDSSVMRASVLLRLRHRLAGDAARLLHLPADLVDRGRQLLGRARRPIARWSTPPPKPPPPWRRAAAWSRRSGSACRRRLRARVEADDTVSTILPTARLELVGEPLHHRLALGFGLFARDLAVLGGARALGLELLGGGARIARLGWRRRGGGRSAWRRPRRRSAPA